MQVLVILGFLPDEGNYDVRISENEMMMIKENRLLLDLIYKNKIHPSER